MPADERPIFFIHVMKTGGTTLKHRINASFPPQAIYPNKLDDERIVVAQTDIPYLLSIDGERRARTRIYSGHFPYVAAEMLDCPLRLITLLRDPVDRVISHLKQVQKNKGGWRSFSALADVDDPPLEDVYEDDFLKRCFFLNHQVRMFSMTREDRPKTYTDLIEVDEARLQTACANLAKVECIGLLEQFDWFIEQMVSRFSMSAREIAPRHVSAGGRQVSAELRERIAHDNQLDIAFYQHARQLQQQRRSAEA